MYCNLKREIWEKLGKQIQNFSVFIATDIQIFVFVTEWKVEEKSGLNDWVSIRVKIPALEIFMSKGFWAFDILSIDQQPVIELQRALGITAAWHVWLYLLPKCNTKWMENYVGGSIPL